MVKLRVTMRKDGQAVTWYRDSQGRRVRTRAADQDWTKARDMMALGLYGIKIQREQAEAGLGSDGAPMPGLKRGYAIWKTKQGLGNRRNLTGPGIGGHMLDKIRVNYVDDRQVKFGITTDSDKARTKAWANEQKAPWWGWSPASVQKLSLMAAQKFGDSTANVLLALGLAGASAVAEAKRLFRKVA